MELRGQMRHFEEVNEDLRRDMRLQGKETESRELKTSVLESLQLAQKAMTRLEQQEELQVEMQSFQQEARGQLEECEDSVRG